MNFIRMAIFQARELTRNQFFILTVITATSSAFILQYSMRENMSAHLLSDISVRSAMFGTWSLSITATGLIGYQRFQGTLIHLFNSKHKPIAVLSTLLISAAVMGASTFPITFIISCLLQPDLLNSQVFNQMFLWLLFVIAAAITSSLLATLFLATPYAIVYEGVLTIPVIYLSGVFTSNTNQFNILGFVSYLMPMYYPTQAMLEPSRVDDIYIPWVFAFILISIAWICLLYFLLEKVFIRGALNGILDIE